jgi:hypothetical protein
MDVFSVNKRTKIMLTKLMPDQISNFWDIIKYAIEESLPPIAGESPDKMNKILAALLIGKAQCWAIYDKTEKENRFEGIMITKVLYDDISDTKNLLIYCLYGYEKISKKNWFIGIKSLVKFATGQGCSQIIGYSDAPLILKMVERLKGETKYTFVRIPLFNK